MSEPVFLYRGPHPVHREMMERIGADFVAASQGSPLDRARSGIARDFGDRPVVIEGGVPLFESGFLGLFGDAGPIIELAADATHIDIRSPLADRPLHHRLAHRFGETQVDATITVSDYIAAYARTYDRPVEVVHPFIEGEKYGRLSEMTPGGDGETVLCIGKYRPKNGQDIFLEALADTDLEGHLVGPDTEEVGGHGFVELERFYELVDQAAVMVYPARVGAYPVAVLEALASGTPVVTTPMVGNADVVRTVHPNLVCSPEPADVRDSLTWALSQDLAERSQEVGEIFRPEPHLKMFERRYNKVLSELTSS